MAVQYVLPEEIEKRSMEIIAKKLRQREVHLPPDREAVLKRVIHTTADFDYIDNLVFSDYVMEKARKLVKSGANIVTDTMMAQAGVNKKAASMLGVKIHCFMDRPEIAVDAKNRKVTRSAICMEYGARLAGETIFVVGNAPTALLSLYDLMQQNKAKPALIIGVPVGFVNVVEAKELIMSTKVPYIIAKGRKGGSNVAAAICNAILYDAIQSKNDDIGRKTKLEGDSL